MSNKILEEQRRARAEFIKLKKMQQGEILPENDASHVIVPKTFKEKLQNYWYHFKWYTISAVVVIAILAVLVAQCASRESYDFITVFYTYNAVSDEYIEKMEAYIEQYAQDIDGDGKVAVEVVNCSFDMSENNQKLNNAAFAKVQAFIAAEPKAVLYIVDKKGENFLKQINEDGFFDVEPILLSDEFYDACKIESDFLKLPSELKIGYRRIRNTTMQEDKTAQKVHAVCEKIFDEISKEAK